MKHAYLIMAHNNWNQLCRLISFLDCKNNDIYIHIDKKSSGYNIDDIKKSVQISNIVVMSEYKVYWGDYSQIQVEMLLFKTAYTSKNYDYYHLISGEDIPLTSNEETDNFFERNKEKEFIECTSNLTNEMKRRTKLYHFLHKYRRKSKIKLVNNIMMTIDRIFIALQIIFKIDRNRKCNLEWKCGANWVSITHELVGYIISKSEQIEKIFKYSNSGDEMFIQTMAYNSKFRENFYNEHIDDRKNNLRLVEWKRGKNGSPYTFRKEDYELVINSKNLFARKFSEKVDKEIIDMLYKRLNKTK